MTINETSGKPILNETIEKLKEHVEKTKILNSEDLDKVLDSLLSEIVKSVPHRVLAAKFLTQDYLLNIIESEIDEKSDSHGESSVSHV